MAASAMLMPPDAEPVMPASAVTVTASLTSGLGIDLQRIGDQPETGQGGDHRAEAVFGSRVHRGQQRAADRRLLPSANRSRTGRQANASTHKMPSSSAPSTAQIAAIFDTCCTTGAALPATAAMNDWVSPYKRGISVGEEFVA